MHPNLNKNNRSIITVTTCSVLSMKWWSTENCCGGVSLISMKNFAFLPRSFTCLYAWPGRGYLMYVYVPLAAVVCGQAWTHYTNKYVLIFSWPDLISCICSSSWLNCSAVPFVFFVCLFLSGREPVCLSVCLLTMSVVENHFAWHL